MFRAENLQRKLIVFCDMDLSVGCVLKAVLVVEGEPMSSVTQPVNGSLGPN